MRFNKIYMSEFRELGLNQDIVRGVENLGFESPTPIQKKVIPLLLDTDQDVVALAQTGTGKTAAFGLPLINKLDMSSKTCQALVLSPTRELGLQIAKDFENYGKFIKDFRVAAVYGGSSIDKQIRDIKRGVSVIVATPGRLVDLIKRRVVKLDAINYVVLDEADEMLNMGFKTDLDFILGSASEDKNTWLFSATMPREVARIAKDYMSNALEVEAGERNTGAKNIEHVYYMVDGRDRYEATKRIVDLNPEIFGLIFCQTKRQTQEVADKLMADGYSADSLHGDLSQHQRDRVMDKFRKRNIQILVATDVAARGIDVDSITHVINYNIPEEIESYTHRSGRTARAGKKGTSICVITPAELYKIKKIEKIIKSQFTLAKIPSGQEVCEQQMFALIDKIKDTEVDQNEIEKFMPTIADKLQDYTADEIIEKFIYMEFSRFLAYYKKSGRDINKTKSDARDRDRGGRGRDRDRGRGRDRDGGRDRGPRGRDRGDRGERRDRGDRGDRGGSRGGGVSAGHTLIFINAGSTDNLNTGQLINWVCQNCGISGEQIGAIRVRDRFSFFEVQNGLVDKVVNQTGLTMKNRRISMEVSKS